VLAKSSAVITYTPYVLLGSWKVNDVHLVYDGAVRSSFAVGFGLRAIVDH